jgi:integrase/recombinase XerD
VYRQVRATFERAGIDVARLGGRTLRNAFAVRELKQGGSFELVGEFMGHRKLRSTQAYAPTPSTNASTLWPLTDSPDASQ